MQHETDGMRQFNSRLPPVMLALSQLAMILQALAINSSLRTLDVGWNSLCEDQVSEVMHPSTR